MTTTFAMFLLLSLLFVGFSLAFVPPMQKNIMRRHGIKETIRHKMAEDHDVANDACDGTDKQTDKAWYAVVGNRLVSVEDTLKRIEKKISDLGTQMNVILLLSVLLLILTIMWTDGLKLILASLVVMKG